MIKPNACPKCHRPNLPEPNCDKQNDSIIIKTAETVELINELLKRFRERLKGLELDYLDCKELIKHTCDSRDKLEREINILKNVIRYYNNFLNQRPD